MDRSEIAGLYERYGFYLHRRCKQFLGNDEEAYDALQEVFLRCLSKAKGLVDGPQLLPWLNRVTTNHCLNRLRMRAGRRTTVQAEFDTVPGDSGEWFTCLCERQDLVTKALLHCRPAEREVATAYFLDELTLNETAATLNLSVATVRRRLRRFIDRARRRLARP